MAQHPKSRIKAACRGALLLHICLLEQQNRYLLLEQCLQVWHRRQLHGLRPSRIDARGEPPQEIP
jgi:hypothetical protein